MKSEKRSESCDAAKSEPGCDSVCAGGQGELRQRVGLERGEGSATRAQPHRLRERRLQDSTGARRRHAVTLGDLRGGSRLLAPVATGWPRGSGHRSKPISPSYAVSSLW
jgi:hypothetical protein